MARFLLVAAALSLASGMSANAETLRCDISSMYMCEASGCQPVKTSVFNVVDLDRKTIARCDAKGCDTYDAMISESGIFLNIAVPFNSLMAKLAPATGDFVEVVTLVGEVYTSFGSCKGNAGAQ